MQQVVEVTVIYAQLAPSQLLSHVADTLLLVHYFFHVWNKTFSNAVILPVDTSGLLFEVISLWLISTWLNKVSHGCHSSYLVRECLRRYCVFVHAAFITCVIHLVLLFQLQFKVWATFINATLPCCLTFMSSRFVFMKPKFTASTINLTSIIIMLFIIIIIIISGHYSAYQPFLLWHYLPCVTKWGTFIFEGLFWDSFYLFGCWTCCTDPGRGDCMWLLFNVLIQFQHVIDYSRLLNGWNELVETEKNEPFLFIGHKVQNKVSKVIKKRPH